MILCASLTCAASVLWINVFSSSLIEEDDDDARPNPSHRQLPLAPLAEAAAGPFASPSCRIAYPPPPPLFSLLLSSLLSLLPREQRYGWRAEQMSKLTDSNCCWWLLLTVNIAMHRYDTRDQRVAEGLPLLFSHSLLLCPGSSSSHSLPASPLSFTICSSHLTHIVVFAPWVTTPPSFRQAAAAAHGKNNVSRESA